MTDNPAAAQPPFDKLPSLAAQFPPPSFTRYSPSAQGSHDNILAPMVASPAREPKKLDISSLMSPPEPTPFDNFQQGNSTMDMEVTFSKGRQQPAIPSPPISPYATPATTNVPAATPDVRDPILYPRSESASSPSAPPQPLFAEESRNRRDIDRHVASRDQTLFTSVAPPSPQEYDLILSFRSSMFALVNKDRKGWLRRNKEQLLRDREARKASVPAPRFPAIRPAQRSHAAETKTMPRPRASHRQDRGDRVIKPAQRPIRQGPTPRRPATDGSPEPTKRTVAPNRDDKDFNSLPDFCPPLSSLPDRPSSLKVEWKGAPVDLSHDPNRHLLDPQEVQLAATLRLECATYLTSKRRIFIRRLECARTGKEFRKTDAQQACNIDVNKASKLWQAFEKVGWLKVEWVKQWI